MKPSARTLRERWIHDPWQALAVKVLTGLAQGQPPPTSEISLHEGRHDLRGLTFPEPQETGEVRWSPPELPRPKTFRVTQGRFESHGATLANVDLSFAVLGLTDWQKILFRDVLFRGASVRRCHFTDCRFLDVSFEDADLKNTSLGGYAGSPPSEYRRTYFVGTDMRDSSYQYASFEECKFVNAKLDKLDFQGARFSKCTFEGKLGQVWFRGWYSHPHPADLEYFERVGIDPRSIRNPMDGIDFSKAQLDDVMFVDEIDLSRCKFPEDGHHILLEDRVGICDEVMRTVAESWPEPSRSEALAFVRKFRDRPDKSAQRIDVVNRQSFEENRYVGLRGNPSWLPSLLDALQQVAQKFETKPIPRQTVRSRQSDAVAEHQSGSPSQ